MSSEHALNQTLIDQLSSGKELTSAQLKEFCSLSESSHFPSQFEKVLVSNTKNILHSLASSCETHLKTSKELKTSTFVAQFARLISSNTISSVSTVCEDYLKNCDVPMHFYLALYSSVCVKYEPSKTTMIPTLLSFLALTESDLCEFAAFSLILLVRTSSDSEPQICKYLQDLLAQESPSLSPKSFAILAKALETFFPVLPEPMTRIYMSDACKQAFLYQGLLLNPEREAADFSTAEKLLHVLSSSCIREDARKFNTENYLSLLIAGSNVENCALVRALSLLCIVKLWNFSAIEKQMSMDSVFTKTVSLFVAAEPLSEECKSLLEALAYLSLGTAIKTALRANEQAIEQLVLILETSKDPSVIYGVLSVVSNLCHVKSEGSDKDTNTLNYLKSMSAEKGNSGDDETDVLTFNKAMISQHKLVSTLAGLKQVKENSAAHIVQILFSLSSKQSIEIQREIVAQGGLNLSIKYLVDHSKVCKETSGTIPISSDEAVLETRLRCLRTLVTLCRSVNPNVAFSKYDVKTCVPFLIELLGPEASRDPNTPFLAESLLGPADKLCSLLALTNLSSLADPALHSSIISRSFEQHLKNHIIDSSLFAVQKAAWELINNLISNPLMLAKFFNSESAESRKNLDLLVKMLHSQNESLQVVIAGLIANATMEFDLVCLSILTQKSIFDNLRKILALIFTQQAQNEDLILRVATFFCGLISVAQHSYKPALTVLKSDAALKSGVKMVVISTQNPDVMALMHEAIELAEMNF